MSSGGTLYAIAADGIPLVKIGCTTGTVEKRLKSLQTGQPFSLHVLASVPVEADVQRIEKQVHAFLAQERRRGEWCEISFDAAALALEPYLHLDVAAFDTEHDLQEVAHGGA